MENNNDNLNNTETPEVDNQISENQNPTENQENSSKKSVLDTFFEQFEDEKNDESVKPEEKPQVKSEDYKNEFDFSLEKNIKQYKMPVNKKPLIALVIIILVAALGFGGFKLFNYFIDKNYVELVSFSINIESSKTIDVGFVGESVDLHGIVLTKEYSNGKKEAISDVNQVKNYISSNTINLDDDLKIGSQKDDGKIVFEFEGKSCEVKVKTSEKNLKGIEVICSDSYSKSTGISFDSLVILKVYGEEGELGKQALTLDEMKNSLTAEINEIGLNKTETGFDLTSVSSGSDISVKFLFDGKDVTATIQII